MRTHSTLRNSPLRFLVILPFVLTGAFLSAFYLYLAMPQYESTIIIKAPETSDKPTSLSLFPTNTTAITEEIASPAFVSAAFDKASPLVQCYTTTDFHKVATPYSFPYNVEVRPVGNKNYEPQYYTIRHTGHTFTLASTSYGVTRYKQGQFGQEFIDNNIAIKITQRTGTKAATGLLPITPSYSFIVHSPASLAKEITRSNGTLRVTDNNGVITITTRSPQPAHAPLLAQSLADYFLAGNAEDNSIPTATATDKQLEETATRIARTEKEIAQYKQQNHLTNVDAETEESLALMRELKVQKTTLELQLAALDNLSLYLRKNRETNNSQVEYGAIQDPAFAEQVQQLNQKYEDKTNGKATEQTDREIENLKLLISERMLNTRKKATIQLEKLNQTIGSLQYKLNRLPEQANMLQALERKMQLDKKVYDLLISQKAGFILRNTGIGDGVRILQPASQPTLPSWPVNWIVITLGAAAGLITGIAYVKLRLRRSSRLVSTEIDAGSLTRIPFLATVGFSGSKNTDNQLPVNNLCTALLMKPEVKVITFASNEAGDGKTFIITGLAQGLAALDKRVLVVDLNLDTPAVNSRFSITPDRCLSDVLKGECDIHDAICLTSFPNLEVIAAGNLANGIHTFLTSSKREGLLKELRKYYDYILVDTCPMNEKNDAVALMQFSDMNLMVVRSNATRKSSLLTAEKLQSDLNVSNLYFVLNTYNRPAKTNKLPKRRNQTKIQRNKPGSLVQKATPSVLRRIALWFY